MQTKFGFAECSISNLMIWEAFSSFREHAMWRGVLPTTKPVSSFKQKWTCKFYCIIFSMSNQYLHRRAVHFASQSRTWTCIHYQYLTLHLDQPSCPIVILRVRDQSRRVLHMLNIVGSTMSTSNWNQIKLELLEIICKNEKSIKQFYVSMETFQY